MPSDAIMRLQKLCNDYGNELLREICQIFCDSVGDQIRILERHLRNGDLSGIQFSGHKMKSSGANLGFLRFAELCEYFEYLNSEAPEQETIRYLNELKAEYEKAKSVLHRFLELAS